MGYKDCGSLVYYVSNCFLCVYSVLFKFYIDFLKTGFFFHFRNAWDMSLLIIGSETKEFELYNLISREIGVVNWLWKLKLIKQIFKKAYATL